MQPTAKGYTINYKRPFLYDYQRAIVDSAARYTVCEAATKVGKTASHIIWLFEQALILKPGQAVWWIAPTIGQAKIAFDRMKIQITNKQLFKTNEALRTITLVTGGKIEFKTASDPDNLYGEDVYAFVFDEFTRSTEKAWIALRTTITSTGGKGKFIGNVKGSKNWGHKLAMRAKNAFTDEDKKQFQYFRITAYDAAKAGMLTKDGRPFLEEIEAAKRELPEQAFKELYLAEATDEGSNPFGYRFIRACTSEMSTLESICFGGDLAKSFDYTAITGLDKYATVSYLDVYQKDWKQTTSDLISLPAPLCVDSTGVGDPIFEAIQAGGKYDVEGYKITSASRQPLLEGLALAIQQRKILFPEGVITSQLENFEFVYTRDGVKYRVPDGEHDDAVFSLALAWHKYKQVVQQIDAGPNVW